MVASAPIFLWLVLCLDGPACRDAQVFVNDTFPTTASVTVAKSDCKKQLKRRAKQLRASDTRNWNLGCETEEQFNKRWN